LAEIRGTDWMNKAHLLKGLVTILVGLEPGALGEIAALGGVSEEDLRAFMRLNAGEKALRSAYAGLFEGVRKYLKAGNRTWPHEVQSIAAMLSDQFQDDRRIPFFLNPLAIRAALSQGDQFNRFMEMYEGCWRIFRPSSAITGGSGVNRWFLNIKPRRGLEAIEQPAPLFSYYFREEHGKEEPGMGVEDRSKVVGLVFPMAERVSFLGKRLSSFNPHLVAMIWPMRETRKGHVRHALGLSLIPNARREHVASYVWASFIDGSDHWNDETYERRRREEIDAVGRYDMEKKAEYDAVKEMIGESHMAQFDKIRAERPIVFG
jgi:hypothetical protein